MITAWRLVKTRSAVTAFDGEGAWKEGGRWNSVGTRVAYAADSLALAALEVLVGLKRAPLLSSYSSISVRFPEARVEVLDPSALPSTWRDYPAPPELQAIGDKWFVESRSLVLQVPSAIIVSASNYLINPIHPTFSSAIVSISESFEFDARLIAPTKTP